MEVVAVINRKGGVGKTATAHALGAGLKRKGCQVLYIDLDSQCNLSYALGASTAGYSSMDLLRGSPPEIQHTGQGDVIAGAADLASADLILTGTGKEYRLREAVQGLAYDYIIIDTPAALGALTVNALTAASRVVIPAQADIYSLQGLGQIYDAIRAVQKYCNPRLIVDGILVTRYNARTVISRDLRAALEDVAAQNDTRVYQTPIRECTAIKEAQAQKVDIFTYSPRSNAAKDYAAFVEEFMALS